MIVKPLYRYKRADGGITDTPNKPEGEYTERVRIIADEGKAVTKDGKHFFLVKDADSIEGWDEVTLEEYNRILEEQNPAIGPDPAEL